ncbi:MAG TPA: APC family permease [Chloroflexota bacterium]|nr:APC family permease [Chloroflexota bacterium]
MAAPATRQVTTAPELRHGALTLSEATVTGLSNMAPAMSLFFAVSFIAGSVGAAIPFIFLLAMIGILFTANSLAQFARIYPSAGSFITYITTSFGPQIGTVLATFLMVGYAVAAGAVYAVLGGWTADVLARDLGIHINWLIVMFVLLAAFEVLLVLGVQVSTRAALVLFLFETIVLLVLGIIMVANNGSHLSATPFAPPSGTALTGIATGFALAIYSFVGWEASAPLAEETSNPRRNVPIALLIAVIVLAAIYVFVTYAVVIAYGVGHVHKLASDLTPFATLAHIYFGPLRGLVDIAGITSISASMLALTNTQGRILFHGGRAGIFPSFLGHIHPRFQTPWVALITYGVMVVVAVLVTMAWLGAAKLANDPFTIYGVLGTFGTLPLIIIYALTSVALIVYTARHSHEHFNPLTHYIAPAVGFLVMLAPAWSFFQTTTPPFDRVAEITLLLFAFALVYGLIIAYTRPQAAARVGEAIEGVEKARGLAEV